MKEISKMVHTKILYEHENKQKSQLLRKNQTKEEGKLWHLFLKQYEVRFTRQKLIGNYIVDFYCHRARLVIEIDGSQHYEEENKVYDQERTKYLEKIGLKVLRFTNLEVNRNIRGVCLKIDNEVKSRL